jgi:hypothetical protein
LGIIKTLLRIAIMNQINLALPQASCFLVLITFYLNSCNDKDIYKRDLLSNDIDKIDEACFKLGEAKDTSAVKLLLINILDPRMSTNLRYKGMTVNYCRLGALRKIAGTDFGRKIDQFKVDTIATNIYLDWAVRKGYIRNTGEVDIYYKR